MAVGVLEEMFALTGGSHTTTCGDDTLDGEVDGYEQATKEWTMLEKSLMNVFHQIKARVAQERRWLKDEKMKVKERQRDTVSSSFTVAPAAASQSMLNFNTDAKAAPPADATIKRSAGMPQMLSTRPAGGSVAAIGFARDHKFNASSTSGDALTLSNVAPSAEQDSTDAGTRVLSQTLGSDPEYCPATRAAKPPGVIAISPKSAVQHEPLKDCGVVTHTTGFLGIETDCMSVPFPAKLADSEIVANRRVEQIPAKPSMAPAEWLAAEKKDVIPDDSLIAKTGAPVDTQPGAIGAEIHPALSDSHSRRPFAMGDESEDDEDAGWEALIDEEIDATPAHTDTSESTAIEDAAALKPACIGIESSGGGGEDTEASSADRMDSAQCDASVWSGPLSWAERALIASSSKNAAARDKADKSEKAHPKVEPTKVRSEASASRTAVHMVLADVKELLSGIWEGNRGEHYEFNFLNENFCVCSRWSDDGSKKDFPVRWDKESYVLRWGQTYFLDPKDLLADKASACWFGSTDSRKLNPRFVWRRPTFTA